MRLVSLGRKGRPQLKDVGEQYRQEVATNGDRLRIAEQMGSAATLAGKSCPPKAGQSAFGPKGRCAKKKYVKDLRDAMVKSIESLDKDQGALVVGRQLAATGVDIQTCLTVARSALRERSTCERSRRATVEESLAKFRNGEGEANLARLREAILGLPECGLLPVPSSHNLCFECSPAQVEQVSHAVSWAYTAKQANTSAAMRRIWDEQHHTIMESDCTPIVGKEPAPTLCKMAGMCLCGPSGRLLQGFKNAFLRSMKRVFPSESANRAALMAGNILVRLVATPDSLDKDAWLELEDPVQTLYLHVGLMYLSPYQPVFMLVERQEAPGSQFGSEVTFVKALCWVDSPSRGPEFGIAGMGGFSF